jgi:hypothetical protein
VEQPTARRRRHASSANSVTVAELQAKSTPAEPASPSAIQERAAAIEARTPPPATGAVTGPAWTPTLPPRPPQDRPPSTELVKYEDATEEAGTSNRLTKTIAVALVAMAVCGAVTAVAVLTGGRPHRLSPSVPALQPAVTAGPVLVRPDAMIDQLVNGSLGSIPDGGAVSGANGISDGAAAGAAGGDVGQQGPLASRETAEEIIKQFYGALPLKKDEAFGLLGTAMQGDGFKSFDGAWRGTRSVEVRVLRPRQEDGALLRLAVSVEQLDGSVLQLIELAEVRSVSMPDAAPAPRIVGVRLLSAHQG